MPDSVDLREGREVLKVLKLKHSCYQVTAACSAKNAAKLQRRVKCALIQVRMVCVQAVEEDAQEQALLH